MKIINMPWAVCKFIYNAFIVTCKFVYSKLLKLFLDMAYEEGKPSKGFIGFWVSLAVIVHRFIKTGNDIPDNWLTLIMTLLAYNGSKKITDAYVGKKNKTSTAQKAGADEEDPVN